MWTGKGYYEHLLKNGYNVEDDHNEKYWHSDWATLNQLSRSKTAVIMFTGNVMDDETNVYRTFSIHPIGERFDPYSLAIET